MNTRILAQTKPSRTSSQPVRSNVLQRKCACGGTPGPTGECEECRKKRESKSLQRQTAHPSSLIDHFSEIPSIVHDVLNSPGQPLDAETRAFMEPRFGHDFGHVRVHTDAQAADSAHAVHAHAYTVGQNVVFSESNYAPSTLAGRKLLAHELAHTIQQRNARGAPASADRNEVLEATANAAARSVADGRHASQACSRAGSKFSVPQTAILAGKIVCGRPDTAGK